MASAARNDRSQPPLVQIATVEGNAPAAVSAASAGYAGLLPSSWQEGWARAAAPAPGRALVGGAEVRTVPSALFPTLGAAVPKPSRGSASPLPDVVVRLLPGVYTERLHIVVPVVIVGASENMPTIRSLGREGVKIAGAAASSSALRHLRLCAEPGGHALCIQDSSPLIEGCELTGAGGAPARGAPAGLDVRGSGARPTIRGCRISGHAGAGASFGHSAGGILGTCEISRCGCGVWLDTGADPLIWRNTIAGHRGAGLVVRADGAGCSIGNTVLRNGAGGVLVESARRANAVITQNRVWANTGLDLRQSPASSGRSAAEAGALLLQNTIGQQGPGDGGGAPPGAALSVAWPRRAVHNAAELTEALRAAPSDRTVLIEVVGRVDLEAPLVLDRPVVLAGAERGAAELWAPAGAEAAVVVTSGGEASALWWLTVRLPSGGVSRARAGASCVDVTVGRPAFVECDLAASSSSGTGGAELRAVLTHAVRATGPCAAPLLVGCALRGATGTGLLLDRGATATLVQCEVAGNQQGGAFLGDGAALVLESCEVRDNGHFGVVIGPHATGARFGRVNFSGNAAGSIWHCGSGLAPAEGEPMAPFPVGAVLPPPVWLDQCSLSGPGAASQGQTTRGGQGSTGTAVVVGPSTAVMIWDSPFAEVRGSEPSVRAEATASVMVAADSSGPGWPGWGALGAVGGGVQRRLSTPSLLVAGGGEAALLDISGAAPPPPPAPRPVERPSAGPAAQRPLPTLQAQQAVTQRSAAGYAQPDQSSQQSGQQSAASRGGYPAGHQRVTSAPGASPPDAPAEQPHTSEAAPGSFAPPPGPDGLARAASVPADMGGQRDDSPHPAWLGSPPADRRAGNAPGFPLAAQSSEPSLLQSSGFDGSDQGSPTPEDQFTGDGEEHHAAWLRAKISAAPAEAPGGELPSTESNRKMLWQLLAMLTGRLGCADALDVAGLGGAMKTGDAIFVRGHTGLYLGLKGDREIVCNKPNRSTALSFVVETKAATKNASLRHGAVAVFRLPEHPNGIANLRLSVVAGGEVKAVQPGTGGRDADAQWSVQTAAATPSAIVSGNPLALKNVGSGKNIDVEGEAVRARTSEKSTLHRLILEKEPQDDEVPEPCADLELTVEEKAWLFRRGVQLALIDKQVLAKFVSHHRPGCKELLSSYTRLWEAEWRMEWPIIAESRPSGGGGDLSPASRVSGATAASGQQGVDRPSMTSAGSAARRPRSSSGSRGRRSKTMDWLYDKVGDVVDHMQGTSQGDKANGDLFVSALRSFFATALRMSQLEADPVQRVIEAFAAALVADAAFMEVFEPSMLPEKERRAYKQPQDVLFGLTYTTMMLNTDAHSAQVSTKMWDAKKFVGAGKDCGVNGGLMLSIFKNVQKEEL